MAAVAAAVLGWLLVALVTTGVGLAGGVYLYFHETVLDIALQCGFGDVSNFNRAFRAEFGLSPRAYRLRSK